MIELKKRIREQVMPYTLREDIEELIEEYEKKIERLQKTKRIILKEEE